MHELELLQIALDNEGISPAHQISIKRFLEILMARDLKTGLHSIRVGICSANIGKHCDIRGITSRCLLWAGLLHDIGKALIDAKLLTKTGRFTETDYKGIEPHVEFGWRMFQGIHEYTAHIIVRHHQFGLRPYPTEIPPLPLALEGRRRIIEISARLLALADYYDALMTRDNAKFGATPLSAEAKRKKYIEGNLDQKDLILKLEKAGVFNFS